MGDRSNQLLLHALTRASADGGGVPLFTSKTAEGLFPNTAPGKQAAQRCRDDGLLAPLGESADKGPGLNCAITDKGRSFLLEQFTPRQVLEDFVRVLETRETQVLQLAESARRLHASLEGLRGTVAAALSRLERPSGDPNAVASRFRAGSDPTPHVLAALEQRDGAGDCPLPELFRLTRLRCPDTTIGTFHDALRRLQREGSAYLHPWTGPLYDLPEPPFALLAGHSVAYYARARNDDGAAREGEHRQKATFLSLSDKEV